MQLVREQDIDYLEQFLNAVEKELTNNCLKPIEKKRLEFKRDSLQAQINKYREVLKCL